MPLEERSVDKSDGVQKIPMSSDVILILIDHYGSGMNFYDIFHESQINYCYIANFMNRFQGRRSMSWQSWHTISHSISDRINNAIVESVKFDDFSTMDDISTNYWMYGLWNLLISHCIFFISWHEIPLWDTALIFEECKRIWCRIFARR